MKFEYTGVGDLAVRLARHLHKYHVDRWCAAVSAAKYYSVNANDVYGEMDTGSYDSRKGPRTHGTR